MLRRNVSATQSQGYGERHSTIRTSGADCRIKLYSFPPPGNAGTKQKWPFRWALGQSVVLRTITGPMLTDTVLDITRSYRCSRV
jgi:hypothetical protein